MFYIIVITRILVWLLCFSYACPGLPAHRMTNSAYQNLGELGGDENYPILTQLLKLVFIPPSSPGSPPWYAGLSSVRHDCCGQTGMSKRAGARDLLATLW